MLQEPTVVHSEPGRPSTTHVVHALVQFLLAVRYRKNVVITSLVVAGLLGGLYYATATRYYGATAQVLVMMRTDPGSLSPSVTSEGIQQRNIMPTFESLFASSKVIEGAISGLKPEDCVDMGDAPQSAWASIVKANLTAQVLQHTKIIEVSYRSKDPQAAVTIVKAVVDSYRNFLDRTHKGVASEVKEMLTKEKIEVAERLGKKEEELVKAQREVRDFGLPSESKVLHPDIELVFSVSKACQDTHRRRVELESSLAALQRAIRNGEDLQQHVMAIADVVGRELLLSTLGIGQEDSYIRAEIERGLLQDQAELERLREQEQCGTAHPKVLALNRKILLTQRYLMEYQHRVSQKLTEMQNTQLGPQLVQMLKQQLETTWQEEGRLLAWYRQVEANAISSQGRVARLEILKRDVEYERKWKETLLERLSNIELSHDSEEVRTEVVHEPVQSDIPVSPNLRRVALLALFGGLAAGFALVYVLDILDDRFRSIEELQGQLSVPVLAMVRQLAPQAASGPDALQVHFAPNSAAAEAFRTLRTALALADKEARQIVISSAEPGDGKTTVLANLAVSYAQSDKRTLLIDADLRRPGMTALLGLRGVDGLSGVVRGEDNVVEMATARIRPSGVAGLDVLPSGPRPTNPAELLANPRFSELLAWAEGVYDQVLIDSPPTLATSDTAVIGRLVDGVVLVVQPEKNRRRAVMRAAEGLTVLKIPLLGIVVNRVGDDNDRGYYGYGAYGYGYAPDYGADEEDAEVEATGAKGTGVEQGVVDPEELPFRAVAVGGVESPAAAPADPRPGIVPRRVA